MSDTERTWNGRRAFLTALGGLGISGLTWEIQAATARQTALDMFNEAAERSRCISPQPSSSLQFDLANLPKDLTLTGTRLLKLGFLDETAQLYGQRTGKSVRVIGGGCDDGLISTRSGKAHFGELCCPVQGSPAEGMRWLPVAQDLKVVLTSPDNPVRDISLSDLRKVATGNIQDWRELGGQNRPIAFIVQNHCPPYLEPVRNTLLNEGKPWSRYAMRSKTDSDHLRHLARFSHSLGVDSWVLAAPYVKAGQLKVLSVDGIMPSVSSAASGGYALTGPLNLIFAVWMEDLMRPYLDFLYSDEAQKIIAKRVIPVTRKQAARTGFAPEYFAAKQEKPKQSA